jgi:hypothetical protein
MKDYLGKELKVGDKVFFQPKNYRDGFVTGEIIKLTPQQVRVKYLWHSRPREYLLYPNCVAKIY